ncbi:glycosyl transferase family 1 [Alteromonas sp. KS69]|uniref:glycosyltransferase n=1 Tax=Alteromonas sp. KS69 TaxID=2109917 RepID=UPI000F88A1D9|nr:glycosyltransferase [Alteromonas sp. KS69]RUP76219.1 glycosyl transferase family 1 [Alteromonas sp. KS69]
MGNEKLKVAVIHPEAGVSSSGGSQLNAIELTNAFSESFDVNLLSAKACSKHSKVIPCIPRSTVKNWQKNKLVDRFLTLFFSYPGLFIESVSSFFSYTIYLLFKKYDVLYPNNDYGGLATSSVIRSLRGTPFIYTEHAGLKGDGKVMARDLKFKPDCFIVFNQDMYVKAKVLAPNQRVEIVPNGVDLSRFNRIGEKFEHGLQGKVVLFVASLVRGNLKRLELTISAIEKMDDVCLLVCGSGQDKPYYESFANKLIEDSRFKIVSVDFDEMPNVYRAADVFTLPSKDEPFGRVYLEAMACGLPVVATDDSMRRQLVGEAGYVCEVEDVDKYSESLQKALDRDWGDLPIQQAEKYSLTSVAAQYEKIIRSVAK